MPASLLPTSAPPVIFTPFCLNSYHTPLSGRQRSGAPGLRVVGSCPISDLSTLGALLSGVIRIPSQTTIVTTETFTPILYTLTYDNFDEAISLNNTVSQGLLSSTFTINLREEERSVNGPDCGITNVNIGTSDAKIGGEKQTGSGQKVSLDAQKTYMRRSTNTVNYSDELPLAQSIKYR
uniref:D1308a n=1 Tax=Mycobacterium leprae TaxID=1769 RepID=Q49663_MYCLR|nr:d1308a [Mycobacterium leprae]